MMRILKALERRYDRGEWWPSGRFPDKRWEVCTGAVLTQNTNWKNVEKALDCMKENGLTAHDDILRAGTRTIEKAVRPSGFYRQKARRLKTLAKFIASFGGMDEFSKGVTREQLLSISGIGNETADSILLYALDRKEFVVDAYTKRVFSRVGILDGTESYMKMKERLSAEVPKSLYANFHAWIVELAKEYCKKIPECDGCPVRGMCDLGRSL